ncbi:MAG: hypothetical protein CL947_04440 [Epsilonproteobacteria bacterium]|nr:hypothetical protein [Campylobacterota bacterium]
MQIKTETKVGIFVIIAIGLFIFMTLGIGAFRFGYYGYSPYKVSFSDVSGLARKADVKIAGVKVGFVEDIQLSNETGKAMADIMVEKEYTLYDNAYAVVRQEGLIGTKYLEITPGDPMLPKLQSGERLARPGRESVSVDELLFKFKTIANHVEQFTDTLKEAFAGDDKTNQIKATIENVANASLKIDRLATSLEGVISGNEDSLHKIINNVENITDSLKTDLPSLKESFTKFATETTESLSTAAHEARETFENLSSVTQKLDDGRGLLGKLINEEEMYKDIKSTVSGIKNYLGKFDSVGVIIDSHSETLQRPVDDFKFTDTKGYFNIRIHTNDNFFYQGQIASSEKGFVSREYSYQTFLDSRSKDYQEIPYTDIKNADYTSESAIALNEYNKRTLAPQKVIQKRIPYAYGVQIGKIYGNLAVRAGLFEGSFGAGVDYYIPLQEGKFSWVTSLEIFDFKGLQRLEFQKQRRPHVKWLNKVFIFNNLYTTMGADDFVSGNASLFWGFGIRFADDDIKYLISKIGFSMPS